MVIHLRTAIRTIQKSRQGICFTPSVNASRCLAELLGKLPRFLIHDSFVGVLKDQPFLLRNLDCCSVLIGLLMSTEVDGMPHILGLGKNLSNDIATPIIRIGKFFFAFPYTLVLLAEIHGRGFHLIIKKDSGNVIGTFALDGQLEDTANDRRRFFINMPSVLIPRQLLIAIDGRVSGWLTRFAFDANGGALLATQISQIPLVHYVEERSELIAVLIVAVHSVGNGNEVNAVLTEHHLSVKARLQIISADSAHILYQDVSHLSGFNIRYQLLPRRSVKVSSTPTVVGVVLDIGVSSLCRIAFEVLFLIHDRITIANLVIVTGKSLVQCRNLIGILSHSLFHAHTALLSDCRLICGDSIIPQISDFSMGKSNVSI